MQGGEQHLPQNAPHVFCAIAMNAFFLQVSFLLNQVTILESYVGSHFHGTYFLKLMGPMVSFHLVSCRLLAIYLLLTLNN